LGYWFELNQATYRKFVKPVVDKAIMVM
jgi:hypothetical protein